MDKDILVEIGSRIAMIRRSYGMTQEKLADELGVSPKHISHSENGTSGFSLKNLIQICNLFECSLDYIVFGNRNDSTLSKLPPEIVTVLNTGSKEELDRLNRYLNVLVDFVLASAFLTFLFFLILVFHFLAAINKTRFIYSYSGS